MKARARVGDGTKETLLLPRCRVSCSLQGLEQGLGVLELCGRLWTQTGPLGLMAAEAKIQPSSRMQLTLGGAEEEVFNRFLETSSEDF